MYFYSVICTDGRNLSAFLFSFIEIVSDEIVSICLLTWCLYLISFRNLSLSLSGGIVKSGHQSSRALMSAESLCPVTGPTALFPPSREGWSLWARIERNTEKNPSNNSLSHKRGSEPSERSGVSKRSEHGGASSMSERCEQTSKQTSKWPGSAVWVLVYSGPQCDEIKRVWNRFIDSCFWQCLFKLKVPILRKKCPGCCWN